MSVETLPPGPYDDDVPWVEPLYSKTQVDKAGKTLVSPAATTAEQTQALAVIDNWRQSHAFPLNTFQVNLRNRARKVDPEAIVTQRLKRLTSIEDKLVRLGSFGLSRIQDLGGCRAVVQSVDDVRAVVALHLSSRGRQELKPPIDDYLADPRRTGYRSVHLVYRYMGEKQAYRSLLIEVQVRSQLQHAWATAVETVGTLTGQPLKAGQGDEQWLRFFALMASALAIWERCPTVPGTPFNLAPIRSEVRDLEGSLKAVDRMEVFNRALRETEDLPATGGDLFLLSLDPRSGTLEIIGFTYRQRGRAYDSFFTLEQDRTRDVVLVAADDAKALRKAYPNYFYDTRMFVNAVRHLLA